MVDAVHSGGRTTLGTGKELGPGRLNTEGAVEGSGRLAWNAAQAAQARPSMWQLRSKDAVPDRLRQADC